jgi:hypothetical protein
MPMSLVASLGSTTRDDVRHVVRACDEAGSHQFIFIATNDGVAELDELAGMLRSLSLVLVS